MAKIHVGATLTPYFSDFLPPWVARQPWYRGDGIPALTPVGDLSGRPDNATPHADAADGASSSA